MDIFRKLGRRGGSVHGLFYVPALRMISITPMLIESTSTTLSSTVAYLRSQADKSPPRASSGSVSSVADRGTLAPTESGMSAADVRSRWRETAEELARFC